MQEVYKLKDGLKKLIDEVSLLKNKKTWNIVVLIAWWSASWKTSQVAKKVLENFKDEALLLSMDNYYRGLEYYKKYNLNFDQPEALDIEAFHNDLEKIKAGKIIKIPKYDFANSKPIPNALEIKPKKIIIIEWLFTLLDEIANLWDIKVFIDLWEHWRILRRIFRDIVRTWQKPQEILDYFLDTVEPMNDKYIEPTKVNADFIIMNEFEPVFETKQIKVVDLQKKYNIKNYNIDHIKELALKLWAQYLWDVEYSDYFFTPHYVDWRVIDNEEIIFIRNIWFWKNLFVYKWPLSQNKDYEERFFVNFFVDGKTLNKMREIYGNDIDILRRKWSCYLYKWVTIFLDIFESWDQILEFKFASFDKKTKEIIDLFVNQICH